MADDAALAKPVFHRRGVGLFAAVGVDCRRLNVNSDCSTRPAGRHGAINDGASSGDLAKAPAGVRQGRRGTAAGGGAPPMAPAPGVGPSGSPRAPSSLDQLVRLLQQRREALLNSATGVGQAAQPLPAARATGLLGF